MNLRSSRLLEHQPDLDLIFRERRYLRAQMMNHQPQQITNYFCIKHIDIPNITFFKYHPIYQLITGFNARHQYLAWNLFGDQVYENDQMIDKLNLRISIFTKTLSIIGSTNTIFKQGYFNIQMFDYNTLQQKGTLYLGRGVEYVYENVHFNQMVFINERTTIVIAKLKNYEIIRNVFNLEISGFIDQQKYIMLISGYNGVKMYFNSKNKTKLVRSFKNYKFNIDSFNGRIYSTSNPCNNLSETKLIDICTMKNKICIQKEDRCLQSIFIHELGLFAILYVNTLDIFDSSSFQLVGCDQLLDNKLYRKNTLQMAYDSSQLLIFYQTQRKFQRLYN